MKRIVLIVLVAVALAACTKVENHRIPYSSVNIALDNTGLWDTYGVHALGDCRIFNKSQKIPSNFAYTAMTFTGYGGVMLVAGVDNTPLAYDCCCPVECAPGITLFFNSELEAECPTCGSRFDVINGTGSPLSGEAHEKAYGLTIYHAFPASFGGYVITR